MEYIANDGQGITVVLVTIKLTWADSIDIYRANPDLFAYNQQK
jgi:hypothetical protein